MVRRLDGLIISGGPDVAPDRYGAEPHERTQTTRPERDAWELALLDAAEAAGLPTLGICRGMQLMAVRAGGTLQQHLPDVVGHDEHSPGRDAFGWVSVTTQPDSRVRELVGDRLQVNCHHHQAVATHPGSEVTARAADGTVEAIEDPEHRSGWRCSGIPSTATTTDCSAGWYVRRWSRRQFTSVVSRRGGAWHE